MCKSCLQKEKDIERLNERRERLELKIMRLELLIETIVKAIMRNMT